MLNHVLITPLRQVTIRESEKEEGECVTNARIVVRDTIAAAQANTASHTDQQTGRQAGERNEIELPHNYDSQALEKFSKTRQHHHNDTIVL